jgi:hypothetical protein
VLGRHFGKELHPLRLPWPVLGRSQSRQTAKVAAEARNGTTRDGRATRRSSGPYGQPRTIGATFCPAARGEAV